VRNFFLKFYGVAVEYRRLKIAAAFFEYLPCISLKLTVYNQVCNILLACASYYGMLFSNLLKIIFYSCSGGAARLLTYIYFYLFYAKGG